MKKYILILFAICCSFCFITNAKADTVIYKCRKLIYNCNKLSTEQCKQSTYCNYNQTNGTCVSNGKGVNSCTNGTTDGGYCYISTTIPCDEGWETVEQTTTQEDILGEYVSFCTDTNILKGIRIFGYIIMIAKVLAPVLITIFGIKSMFQAMLDDKADLKENVFILLKKVILAVFIAFIPTIIDAITSSIAAHSELISEYAACETCINNPTNCPID